MNRKRHRSELKSRRVKRAERTRLHQTLVALARRAQRRRGELPIEEAVAAR
jgi:hypothetical protein